MNNDLATVAIIGRANVGKSTLFNRLIEQNKALISDVAGTTRDRNFGICNWRDLSFNVIDTGGITKIDLAQKKNIDEIEEKIINQAQLAAQKADVILFMVDAQTPVLSQDKQAAKLMRQANKPVILVVNKADNLELRKKFTPEVLNLGFDNPQLISAKNGGGIGDLLDTVVENLKKVSVQPVEVPDKESMTKIAIIGKPNVGKSSILNSILGEEQVIVSPVPHTTRSPQDIILNYRDNPYLIIDTAGIRRKTKINDKIEKQSVKMSLKTMEEADVILSIIEAGKPMSKQDKRLIQHAVDKQKSVIIVVNKWDLIPRPKSEEDTREQIWNILPSLKFLPIVFISAKEGFNVGKLLPLVAKVGRQRKQLVDLDELQEILAENKLKKSRLVKLPKVYGLLQARYQPNKFTILVNKIELVPPAFPHIIRKAIREKYEFLGTPISIRVTKRSK